MMVQYSADDIKPKMVYYEGSDELQEGYALCYNRDNTGGGVASADNSRGVNVEQPAAGNIEDFAGVVAPTTPKTGPCWIEILVPESWGPVVNVYTDQNCTINSTLLAVQPGSYALGGSDDGRIVAKALQTVDRSSTNGLAQATLGGVDPASIVSAASRTSVQLPTAAIWDNFPLEALRANAFAGAFLEADFRQAGEVPDRVFTGDATADVTENAIANGEYTLLVSADNEEAAAQWDVPITLSGGNKWGFEARVKILNITDARGTVALGLGFPRALAGDVIADNGAALTDGDFLGIVRFAADGDICDFIYDEASQTTNVHDDDYITVAADTYFTFGMYFNGTTIQGYVDGVATGTAISAADIAAADFPTAAVCVPTFAIKGDNAADISSTLDWIRAAQV